MSFVCGTDLVILKENVTMLPIYLKKRTRIPAIILCVREIHSIQIVHR